VIVMSRRKRAYWAGSWLLAALAVAGGVWLYPELRRYLKARAM
jgi:hypothetical protein